MKTEISNALSFYIELNNIFIILIAFWNVAVWRKQLEMKIGLMYPHLSSHILKITILIYTAVLGHQ